MHMVIIIVRHSSRDPFARQFAIFFSSPSSCPTCHCATMKLKGTPSVSAIESLKALQCKVFGTTYNPTNVRTGAKYLRQALRGPAMVKYYPPVLSIASINKAHPELRLIDPAEVQRLESVAFKKSIGKGPPKKGTLPRRYCPLLQILTVCALYNRRGQESGSQGQEEVATSHTNCTVYQHMQARSYPDLSDMPDTRCMNPMCALPIRQASSKLGHEFGRERRYRQHGSMARRIKEYGGVA